MSENAEVSRSRMARRAVAGAAVALGVGLLAQQVINAFATSADDRFLGISTTAGIFAAVALFIVMPLGAILWFRMNKKRR